jgi:hypothetical protein
MMSHSTLTVVSRKYVMSTAHMSMMTDCARPSTVRDVEMMTMAILSPIVFRLVTATGEARWSRVRGFRLQSLIDWGQTQTKAGGAGVRGQSVRASNGISAPE